MGTKLAAELIETIRCPKNSLTIGRTDPKEVIGHSRSP